MEKGLIGKNILDIGRKLNFWEDTWIIGEMKRFQGIFFLFQKTTILKQKIVLQLFTLCLRSINRSYCVRLSLYLVILK